MSTPTPERKKGESSSSHSELCSPDKLFKELPTETSKFAQLYGTYVKKRNGWYQYIAPAKIGNRVLFLAAGEERNGTRIGKELEHIDVNYVTTRVMEGIRNGMTTHELDIFAANICAQRTSVHHDYALLAGRIVVSDHQKSNRFLFSQVVEHLHVNGGSEYVSRPFYKFVMANAKALDAMIDVKRDYMFDYFGFQTLKKGRYLIGTETVTELPQHMYMRVAICVASKGYALSPVQSPENDEVLARIKATYDLLSTGRYSHATPTMYNSGTETQQLSSCFLLGIADSITENGGIPDCIKACCLISKTAGGIGVGIQSIRPRGSIIRGTRGKSDGISPLSRMFDITAQYINQGGHRPGAIKVTLEPWHADLLEFLELKSPAEGAESRRARYLFYALWIPDLFVKRYIEAIKEDKEVLWSFMCPDACPGLYTTYGDEFEALYEKYEREGRFVRQESIVKVVNAIFTSQQETGGPDILFKDTINRRNAQANLGVIRNSNLCSEILEYSDEKQYAVCNLASVSLVGCCQELDDDKEQKKSMVFDFERLDETCRVAHRNLNAVIDVNYYPHDKCALSNLHHRPVGLGTQGFADMLLALRLPFEKYDERTGKFVINEEVRELNKLIAEHMYYACLSESAQLAEERHAEMKVLHDAYVNGHIVYEDLPRDLREAVGTGNMVVSTKLSPVYMPESFDLDEKYASTIRKLIEKHRPVEAELDRDSHWGAYASFIGSPMQKDGLLQFDMTEPPTVPLTMDVRNNSYKSFLDWEGLRERIRKFGVRNSLVRADMPTASTAHILGNSESTEPYKYVIYTRRTTTAEYVVVNPFVQRYLEEEGQWNEETRELLLAHRGNLEDLPNVSRKLKDLFRSAYDIKTSTLHRLAADRQPFIDQTQSMNSFVAKPSNVILTKMFVNAWRQGLKTGMYYLRTEPAVNMVQFTVQKTATSSNDDEKNERVRLKALATRGRQQQEECMSCSA